MCTYLSQRGATYYFRRIIASELRPAFDGRTEFVVSLRTKDREAAKRLISAHTIETDKLLADARAGLGAAPQASPAAQRGVSAWLTEFAVEHAQRGFREEGERGG